MSEALPELIYYVAVSLDGCIATSDGGVGWLDPFEGGGGDYGYAAFYEGVDALILGRRTYQQVLGFGAWPYADKPCWVMSRQSIPVELPGVTLSAEPPGALMERLAARGHRRVWMVGGGEIAGAFHDAGLITEFQVSLMPVILGAGIPLLGQPGRASALLLQSATPYPDGVVHLVYRSRDAG